MDAKAPHRTDNIHPAPVTDLVNGLPPEIRFRRIPSVTRSSSPDQEYDGVEGVSQFFGTGIRFCAPEAFQAVYAMFRTGLS